MKLLSFTGNGKDGMDGRGWTCVHSDESLEMLSARHLKSLSVDFLGHLQNSAAWPMQVSMFRAPSRYMTVAVRAIRRRRENADGGGRAGPLEEICGGMGTNRCR